MKDCKRSERNTSPRRTTTWLRGLRKHPTTAIWLDFLFAHSDGRGLVRTRTDPKTVQALLRHANVKTTLQLYAHSVSEDRMAAQGLALAAFLQPPATGAVN